jgi:hypothetical protein
MMRLSRTVAGAAVALTLVALTSTAGAPVAAASSTQEATFQDDTLLRSDPAGTLDRLRQLGVARVRVFVGWASIAPSPLSTHRPRAFVASDPASYPASKWAIWDAIVRAAAARSIGLDFVLTGGAPLWATGTGAPAPHPRRGQWKPSAREFGQFVRAIGERYSGNYDPAAHQLDPTSANDLPPVDYWAIWNEPDYGPSLAPQGTHNSTVEYAARMYRGLVDAAWKGLQATGHGYDTILIGELAPRGWDNFGLFSGTKPLRFLRALYCVDSVYRPLMGRAAALRGCPTSAAGRSGFSRAHPALFEASGISDHPYSQSSPPNVEASPDRDFTSLAELSGLERSADRLQRVYGSPTRMPVYLTEYGYITSPPKHNTRTRRYVSPATAAYYMNWAEYLAWRDPRVVTISQYLLLDPMRPNRANNYGGFASGLILHNGTRKATYDAYRLPIYMPVTRAHGPARRLEIWGCARPAGYAFDDTSADQRVAIQFQPHSQGPFVTLFTVPITNASGYFDVLEALPSSGSVRLQWTYPNRGGSVHSRSVRVVVG